MWTLKKGYKQTYLQNKNRITDVEKKLMVTSGERRRRDKLEIGINIYTLLGINIYTYITYIHIYRIDN